MKKRTGCRIGFLYVSCLSAWLWAAPAGANPVSWYVFRARQTASTHVQVTYGVDTNATSGVATAPSEITRDGTALTVEWTKGTYSGNTGSGLVSLQAFQFCDCSVSQGKHDYAIKVTYSGKEQTLTTGLTVESTPPIPADMGVGRDLMNWDIPEPPAQGLDCAKACAAPAGDTSATTKDGSTASKDQGSPSTDAGTTVKPQPKDEGGCSVGPGAHLGASLLILGLGLLLGLSRRRR